MARAGTIKIILYRMYLNLKAMLISFAYALPLGIIVGIITYWILNKYKLKKNNPIDTKKIKVQSLLATYIVIMLEMAVLFRNWGSTFQIDLIPFNTAGGIRYIILYGVANIIVFLPIGILVPMAFDKINNIKTVSLIGFFGSFLIEILQLVLRCGVCQIEDLIMNTMGAAIGYWLYKKYLRVKIRRLIMNKILVTKSSMPDFDEYVAEIKDMWETHWLTNMGVKHIQLEEDLAKYLDVKNENIALFVNGHQALECIIEAMELGSENNIWGEPKNEVITTPFTFASTTHAIVRKGLKPVFCDIKEDDFTIDVDKIEELITDRTCAIIPVHVYGNVCDIEGIEKIAKKHNLKVIYDAAHAFGVTKDGVSSAKFGDASMFSFHATKVFNTIEGGAVTFNDSNMKEVLNQWKNFGITGAESVEFVGGNAKMNEFAAAMGICNLRHFDKEIEKRKAVEEKYRSMLDNIEGIQLNPIQENVKRNYAYFPIIVDEDVLGITRDDIFEALAKEGIGARKYFYPLTSDFECYRDMFDSSKTPVALKLSSRVLTLPFYADLSMEDVERICNCIIKTTENK